MNNSSNIAIAYWLFGVCGLVFFMVVIGGLTRLTNSGLSMVEWRPLIGAFPPMSDIEWERVFELYKSSPEYEKKHFWMEMDDFKKIFFWEWFHRFLGRLVGVAYALPLIFFWVRGMIPSRYKIKLLLPFILGGAQGFMGWYMVKSGLVDAPNVSHFRLAAHLSLAFFIMGVLIWLGLSIKKTRTYADPVLFVHGIIATVFLAITVIWGAFTAGLDAGLIFNDSFPMMGDSWLPAQLARDGLSLDIVTRNHETVQFMHRWLAMTASVAILSLWFHAIMRQHTFKSLHFLAAMLFIQFILGLSTLYSYVHIAFASKHQAGAAVLFIIMIVVLKKLKPARD